MEFTSGELYVQPVKIRPYHRTCPAELEEIADFTIHGPTPGVGVHSGVVQRVEVYLKSIWRKAVRLSQHSGLSFDVHEHNLLVSSLDPAYAVLVQGGIDRRFVIAASYYETFNLRLACILIYLAGWCREHEFVPVSEQFRAAFELGYADQVPAGDEIIFLMLYDPDVLFVVHLVVSLVSSVDGIFLDALILVDVVVLGNVLSDLFVNHRVVFTAFVHSGVGLIVLWRAFFVRIDIAPRLAFPYIFMKQRIKAVLRKLFVEAFGYFVFFAVVLVREVQRNYVSDVRPDFFAVFPHPV